MFVALTAHTEFFRKHMQLFIAIAPVMYLSNMSAEMFVLMSKSDTIITLAEQQGPEMLPDPAGTNHSQLNNILASVECANELTVRYTSDCQPELTSSKALMNYGGHFPAGSSYKSMMHFL